MSTNSAARKYWIAVASAERVRRGRGEGFMQINHGKAAPLKRVKPDDGLSFAGAYARQAMKAAI
jgi:hypothetical protein